MSLAPRLRKGPHRWRSTSPRFPLTLPGLCRLRRRKRRLSSSLNLSLLRHLAMPFLKVGRWLMFRSKNMTHISIYISNLDAHWCSCTTPVLVEYNSPTWVVGVTIVMVLPSQVLPQDPLSFCQLKATYATGNNHWNISFKWLQDGFPTEDARDC